MGYLGSQVVTKVCRLCGGSVEAYHQSLKPFPVQYQICPQCDCVQTDLSFLPDRQTETSHYGMHENSKREPGYVAFLDQCLVPTLELLAPGQKGLDYGCGPYPMLAELARERGFEMDVWDPVFFPNCKLDASYDFLTATEVVEHFHYPQEAWEKMVGLARPGALLSVMTSMRYPSLDFEGWHYRRDVTHVCFYSPKTMAWIANAFGLTIVDSLKNIVIFRKR